MAGGRLDVGRVGLLLIGAAAALAVAAQPAAARGGPVSFQAPFGSADFGWTIMGSAVVTEQYVRLTPAEAGHEGAIWSQSNMPFKQWEMELKFKVTGARYLGGDGFALWFTEKSQQFGSTFGNQEDFVGLGVILDTYDNDGKRDNPSISAVTSKGVTKFDHDSDGRDQRVPGAMCKINYRNPRAPVSLKVRYQDNVLFVSYDLRSKGTYTDCFRAPVDLPEAYFVGITAHTGQVADNHDIYSMQTVSLEPHTPEPLPTQDPVPEQHGAHESEGTAHEWRKDDDRHLQRFADAVQRWTEMSEEAKEKARQLRDEAEKLETDSDQDTEDEDESREGGRVVDRDAGGGQGDTEEMTRFREEVSSTLSLIQAEVKQIAHEMRGTITLAHAAPTAGGGGDEEGARVGGSASELVAELGEMLQQNKHAINHEMTSVSQILRSDLEALRKDVAELQDSMRAHVLRNGQETTSKLSQVANDVSKMSLAMQELQKRQDFHAKKLDQSHSSLKEHVVTAGMGGGGVSYTVVILMQVPWVLYAFFSRSKRDKYHLG